MNIQSITRITKAPLQPGFLGDGHTAAAVIDSERYRETDPFILLMDDRLDLPGGPPVGGAHPHAGFETITLVLEGNETDWKTGTLEMMTAGKGIIHTEEITAKQKLRILQFWLVLPPEERWTDPFWQSLSLESVPRICSEFGEVRVYSGSGQGITSPLINRTPFTLVDFIAEANGVISQALPGSYKGFVYVVEGTIQLGDTLIREGELGWLADAGNRSEYQLDIETLERSRFIIFGGEPHNVPVVHHGPFVGDDHADIQHLFDEYRIGAMPHLNQIPRTAKIQHV
jgi:redox-sensitive bicupin YhaK (pirin superfamily)